METHLMTTPQLVSPAEIQTTLSKIWESLEGSNKVRASLFNLIFFTEKNTREPYLRKIAQKVIEKFPSRLIFISYDKNSTQEYLNTSVSVITAQKAECDVACDFIQIEVTPSFEKRVPFLLLSHLLPDLPVYFLWGEDPTKDTPLCTSLEKLATRLIFDSESTDNLPKFAEALLRHHQEMHIEIADLNWARLESIRDLLAQAFYSKERLQDLQKAKKIRITYNAHATASFCHTKIQSLYLQAWLASQLNWSFKEMKQEGKEQHFFYKKDKQETTFLLSAEDHSTLPPGLILNLEIETEDGIDYLFTRSLTALSQITQIISTPDHCEIPCHYLFEKAESGHSLVKEISRKGTSHHYLKVLQQLTTMEKKALC